MAKPAKHDPIVYRDFTGIGSDCYTTTQNLYIDRLILLEHALVHSRGNLLCTYRQSTSRLAGGKALFYYAGYAGTSGTKHYSR